MALRGKELQAAQEEAFPARFTDGSGYISLARRGLGLGRSKRYSTEEWTALIGVQTVRSGATIIANDAWELRNDYAAERLKAQLLSLDGVENIRAVRNELAPQVRTLQDPVAINGYKIAFWILHQATLRPDRRGTYSQMIRALDLTVRLIKTRR